MLTFLFPCLAGWYDKKCGAFLIVSGGYLWSNPDDGWSSPNNPEGCRRCFLDAASKGWGYTYCKKTYIFAVFEALYIIP
jgi:hypothetical protein